MFTRCDCFADWTPGIREYLISPLFTSAFNADQYIRQRRAWSADENASAEPLPPLTFGEMRFTRVPDTAASGAVAGALLTSWKCKVSLRSAAPFTSLRLFDSWISSCSSRGGHFRSFLCHTPTGRKRIQCAAGKIHIKETYTKQESPYSQNRALGIFDATLVQVNRLPARRARRVPLPIKKGEGCVPSANRGTREAGRGGRAQEVIAC